MYPYGVSTLALNSLNTPQIPNLMDEWFLNVKKWENERYPRPHEIFALDCQIVGGPRRINMLARTTLVNFDGHIVFDHLVDPGQMIVDFRTYETGLTEEMFESGFVSPHNYVVDEFCNLVSMTDVVVGHNVGYSLLSMGLQHPSKNMRELSTFACLRTCGNETKAHVGLQELASNHFDMELYSPVHNSADGARVAMLLYRIARDKWERNIYH